MLVLNYGLFLIGCYKSYLCWTNYGNINYQSPKIIHIGLKCSHENSAQFMCMILIFKNIYLSYVNNSDVTYIKYIYNFALIMPSIKHVTVIIIYIDIHFFKGRVLMLFEN